MGHEVDTLLTVQQVAKLMASSEIAVLEHIHSGQLEACNINTKPNAQRKRWRIPASAYGRFIAKTLHVVAEPAKPKRAPRKAVKDYFADSE